MGVGSTTRVLIGCKQLENRFAYRAFAHKFVEPADIGGGRGAAASALALRRPAEPESAALKSLS